MGEVPVCGVVQALKDEDIGAERAWRAYKRGGRTPGVERRRQ